MPRKHSRQKAKKIKEKVKKVEFLSQNVRGIKSDGIIEELFEVLSTRKVIGSDCNSIMGLATEQNDGPLGKFGLPHVNDSSRRFLSYVTINNLAVKSTHFRKKSYTTWIHPRSKKPHQIDHFIVNNEMSHRVTDCGLAEPILESDHRAVSVKLCVMKRLKKKTEPRQKMINLDHSKLFDSNIQKSFCQEVLNNVGPSSQPTYTELAEAVEKAALTSLPKRERAQPGWFQANANKLLPLIDARNQAIGEVFNRRTRACTKILQRARQKLKSAVKDAKDNWIKDQCGVLNLQFGTKHAWDSLKSLKAGLSKTKTRCH